jgi:hypothetical protein
MFMAFRMRNLGGSGGMLPWENFEFLDSLEYFGTMFEEEKLQPQKAIFN